MHSSIMDWRRGICRVLGERGPQVSLLVCQLIAPNARVAWDPVDKDLSRAQPRIPGRRVLWEDRLAARAWKSRMVCWLEPHGKPWSCIAAS